LKFLELEDKTEQRTGRDSLALEENLCGTELSEKVKYKSWRVR
jgi:hypothetical protein